eukprot:11389314-Ditylum_brightwellii.AAC.1
MARSLVLIVRFQGGRFLRKGKNTDTYYEIGDEKAEAKAAQTLREGLEVRATIRKRKEIYIQQREMEYGKRKMARHGEPIPPQEDWDYANYPLSTNLAKHPF